MGVLIIDNDESLFKEWKVEINMVDERGTDNNILIESGKNLEELQQDIDDLDTENFASEVYVINLADVAGALLFSGIS